MGVLTIRPMHLVDVPAIADLELRSFPTPYSADLLRRELAAPDRSYVVAQSDSGMVGYAGAQMQADVGHILTVAVEPGRRRQGIARRLLEHLVAWCAEQGAGAMTLEVRESNLAAQRLYERLGFEAVGTRPRYYRDEDAVVMWLHGLAGYLAGQATMERS